MRVIGKAFRRPPAVRLPDRNGGFQGFRAAHNFETARMATDVPHRHATRVLAESLGKPSLWVIISAPWYKTRAGDSGVCDAWRPRSSASQAGLQLGPIRSEAEAAFRPAPGGAGPGVRARPRGKGFSRLPESPCPAYNSGTQRGAVTPQCHQGIENP